MSKLDWQWDTTANEQRAEYKGLTIRSVQDTDTQNPFEAWDGYWPMLVAYDRNHTAYAEDNSRWAVAEPLGRFTDEALTFNQVALAKLFGFDDVAALIECYGTIDPVKFTQDSEELRDICQQAFDDNTPGSTKVLDELAEIYKLLGVPVLRTTSRGYSQGNYAELLIVATPEAQQALRSKPADMDDETWAKALADDLQSQADLYGAWAWGDVYGYIIEDDEGDEIASCWGYYGVEHDESGLEDAAIEAADAHFEHVKDILPEKAGVSECLI